MSRALDDIAPGEPLAERDSYSDVVLRGMA